MAKLNGCNSDMPKGPVGMRSTRMNPATMTRGNMAKNGVNQHLGGAKAAYKPGVAAGKAGK